MRTYSSDVLSVFRGGNHARQLFIRRIFSVVFTFVLTGHILLGPDFTPANSIQTKRPTPKQRRPLRRSVISPGYDCVGELRQHITETGKQNIEQAIDDALDILRNCESCRQVFHERDSNYAIRLLEKLRRDQVFIISEETPLTFNLSNNRKRLKILTRSSLNDAAAGVVDLAARKARPGGPMLKPCIYVNPRGFIVTGKRAEGFGLYVLNPAMQRALAILHELGHVAGVLQRDGGETEELRHKSVRNTNCIRLNCTLCKEKEFQPCLGQPSTKKASADRSDVNPVSCNRWLPTRLSGG